MGTTQNTSRQLTESASQPATSGPTSDGRTHAAASAENALGRNDSGYARAMRTYSPTMTAPLPTP